MRQLVFVGVGALLAAIAGMVALEIQGIRAWETYSRVGLVFVCLDHFQWDHKLENHWRILNDAEYESLLTEPLDGVPITETGVLDDMWGNRLQVAARKRSDGTGQYIVWSAGPDTISGTDDDIIYSEFRAANTWQKLFFSDANSFSQAPPRRLGREEATFDPSEGSL